MYRAAESPYCILETSRILYVNYTAILKKEERKLYLVFAG